ncbi:MAG TPA: hypothetical protein VFE13_01520 [Caulobacteraceae bacterium]|nr:hypothetical protein [Caulobacteraceae bacterium]
MTKTTVTSGHTVSGASLSSGDLMRVASGALAIDTVIDGGVQKVRAGGETSDARITGGGVEYDFGYASGTLIEAGGLEVVERGGNSDAAVVRTGGRQVVVSGGMANDTILSGGTLIVSAGGSVCGGGFTIHAGKAVIAGDIAAWNTVRFAGSAGTVELDNLAGFAATIAGFHRAKQRLDLGGFAFSADETLTWVQSGTRGALTITDGDKHATLILSGAYTAADFQLADDGHGGTVITPAAAPAARLAQSMAAMAGARGGEAGAGRAAALAPGPHPLLGATISR